VRRRYQLAFIGRTIPMIVEGQFAPPDLNIRRCFEAEANLTAFDFQYRDDDLIPDYDAFANLATEN
jgi:hypothetical protein